MEIFEPILWGFVDLPHPKNKLKQAFQGPQITRGVIRYPLKGQAHKKNQEAAQWNERLKELKKAKPKDNDAIKEAEGRVKELSKEAKKLAKKAKETEDAVYDLKAVNPHKKPVVDTRTPEELLDLI